MTCIQTPKIIPYMDAKDVQVGEKQRPCNPPGGYIIVFWGLKNQNLTNTGRDQSYMKKLLKALRMH